MKVKRGVVSGCSMKVNSVRLKIVFSRMHMNKVGSCIQSKPNGTILHIDTLHYKSLDTPGATKIVSCRFSPKCQRELMLPRSPPPGGDARTRSPGNGRGEVRKALHVLAPLLLAAALAPVLLATTASRTCSMPSGVTPQRCCARRRLHHSSVCFPLLGGGAHTRPPSNRCDKAR